MKRFLNIPYTEKTPDKLFTFLNKIGQGNFGVVWLAQLNETGQRFAVKKIKTTGNIAEYQKEIAIMKDCVHENVVRFYDSYILAKQMCIVMEWCEGKSIRDIMKNLHQPLTEPQVVSVVYDSLKGLEYIHDIGKIHRDIKAGNILIGEKGIAKLCDFGVSAEVQSSLVNRKTFIGTPFWMAPEVVSDAGYNKRADIWSFGITIIEMLEGEPPGFSQDPMTFVFNLPNCTPPELQNPSKWSMELKSFISSCLIKAPEERGTAKSLLKTQPLILKFKNRDAIIQLVELSKKAIEAPETPSLQRSGVLLKKDPSFKRSVIELEISSGVHVGNNDDKSGDESGSSLSMSYSSFSSIDSDFYSCDEEEDSDVEIRGGVSSLNLNECAHCKVTKARFEEKEKEFKKYQKEYKELMLLNSSLSGKLEFAKEML